jgi:hypothetical protein
VIRLTKLFLVKEHERRLLVYFFVFFVLLGTGLALGRGSADAMFFKRYGIENLPAVYALLSVILAIASLVYAAYADRVPSEKFFIALFDGLILFITFTWYLITADSSDYVYPIYFILFEVGSELLPLHAMLYVSQNFETLQAKRLTPIIFAGSQVGRIIGGVSLALVVPYIGVPNILLVWLGVAALSMFLLWLHHRQAGVSPYYRRIRRDRNVLKQSVEQVLQGMRFSRESSLIRASFFSLFFLVLSFYILNYSVNRIYTNHFPTEEGLGRFFGLLTAATSGLALGIQLFVTSRLLERFGVKRINLVYPITSMAAYTALLVSFALPSAIAASFNKDALMPAIRNPTRSLFFNVLPDYMQGRARALSLALVMPAALAIAGGLLIYMQTIDNPLLFLATGLVATVLYLVSNLGMNRAYVGTLMATLKERVFVPGRDLVKAISGVRESRLFEELVQGVHHHNDSLGLAYARMLVEGCPETAPREIVKRIQKSNNMMRDKLVKLLVDRDLPTLKDYFDSFPDDADDHLRATLLTALFNAGDTDARESVVPCLHSDNPRLVATGILGVYRYDIRKYLKYARDKHKSMLISADTASNMAALDLLKHCPDTGLYLELMKLLGSANERVQKAALEAFRQWPSGDYPGLSATLQELYRSFNHQVRAGCVSCYCLLHDTDRHRLTLKALEDSHPTVRQAALHVLLAAGNDIKEAAIPWILENAGTPRAEQALLESLLHEPLPKALFLRIAMEKVRYAQDLRHAALILDRFAVTQNANGARLMRIVLAERINQVINLSLTALRSSEDAEAISVIQAGLSSGDSRQVANAREALHNLRHNQIVRLLDDLLNRDRDTALLSGSERCRFRGMEEMLEWCMGRPDPWLKDVARNTTAYAGQAIN